MNELKKMQEGGPVATDVQQQFRTLDPTTRELYFGVQDPLVEEADELMAVAWKAYSVVWVNQNKLCVNMVDQDLIHP